MSISIQEHQKQMENALKAQDSAIRGFYEGMNKLENKYTPTCSQVEKHKRDCAMISAIAIASIMLISGLLIGHYLIPYNNLSLS